MQRSVTAKDLVLFAALAVLLVMILLSMYMVDRQWSKMAQIQHTMQEQANDLRSLTGLVRALDQGVRSGALAQGGGPAPATVVSATTPDAFTRAYRATQMPGYAPGDWQVQAFGTGLKTITPLISSDVYAAEIQGYVQESLLTRDPETLKWLGLIAKSWQVSNDGLTFTFQMRDDVKFSDGVALTAHDVAFTFAFIMNEKIAAPRSRAYLEKIASVTAKGDHEVVFVFKEPYFDSLALAGGLSIMPRHFYEPYLKEPEVFNQSKGLLLGSGPYRLKDPKAWTPDQGIVELERNPRYWGPILPPFERLVWKVIENDSARLTTFRNGDIDMYSARPREYQSLLNDASLGRRTRHLEYMSPTAGYTYIGWNQLRNDKPTRFADPRVRRAMTLLTDRDRIIGEIFLGYAEIAVSPFNPRSKQHDVTLQPYPASLEQAKALLKEAGYEDRNGDGVLENAKGDAFEFDLVYFQDNDDTKRMVLLLKDLYARAGVLMRPKPTEWSVMLDLLNHKDFDAITLGWSSGVETDIYQMFHSSQIVPGGDDFISYRNPRLDQLIEKARATVDEELRMPLWREAERILHEDQPYTFLMRRKSLTFIDRRFHNVQVTKLGLNLGAPVEWFVPADEQKYH